MLNKMSEYEHFLKKNNFCTWSSVSQWHINRHDRPVFGAEQLRTRHFSLQASQNKVTLGCRLPYDRTIWTSQDYTVRKSIQLYDLYFPTIAKLYFCMTVRFVILCYYLHFHVATAPSGSWSPHYRGFTITLRHTTLSRTPPVKWPARWTDLYLKNPQHSQKTEIHARGGIQTHNPSKRVAA